ncbi:MAG TPA: protein kinase [Polyangiaceae bacterium]
MGGSGNQGAELTAKYQPFAALGEGGMAQVFLAVARGPMGFNKLVVLKRMRSQYAKDEAVVRMFLDEARLAARLNHPNVIHTYEVGEHEGRYFIAMEYLEGQPLNRILAEARRIGREVRPAVWVRILEDVLTGLQYAHDLKDYDGTPLGIVHRDVSPHNMFVTYDGQVKVVDFGIAKAALSEAHTEIGVLKGKVAYMSPEHALGAPLDRRSDLFALGIVLWEAISGQRLYGHEYAATTLHKLLNSTAPRLSSVVPEIDPALDELVVKALATDPADRFQSAREMRDALEAWMQARGEAVRQEEIGRLVCELFEDVRDDVKQQIQAYMAAVAADPSGRGARAAMPGPVQWSASAAELPTIDIHLAASGSAMVRQARVAPASHEGEGPRGGRLALVLAGTLAALVSVGAMLVPRFMSRTSTAGPSPSAPEPLEPARRAVTPEPSGSASLEPTSSSAPLVASAPPSASLAAFARPAPPPPATGRGGGGRLPSVPSPVPPTAEPTSPTPASQPGFLSFDTYPWTRVSEGGRVVGDTPLIHVSLSPGVHVLTLDNEEQNIHQTYTVIIPSGQTVNRRLGLE